MNSEELTSNQPELLPDEIARRYNNRAGFNLVSCREVGLPVYRLTVQALTLLRKSIPPIEEFVLKSIDAGLTSEEDICGFLGLDLSVVRNAMIDLTRSENIYLKATEGSRNQRWQLTKVGEQTLREARISVPEERSFQLHFDGLLRKPRWYGKLENRLLFPKELRALDVMEIPAFPSESPDVTELKLRDVEEVIRQAERASKFKRDGERDFLGLKAVEKPTKRLFQGALALVYESETGGDPQVAFAIDGRLSEEHELAFAHVNGAKKLRILENLKANSSLKLAEEVLGRDFVAQAPILKEKVEAIKEEVETAQAQLQKQVDTVREQLKKTQNSDEVNQLEIQLKSALEKIEELQSQLETALSSVPIRFLEVYEHRPLLEQALKESEKRLLIVAPWIRANATNTWIIQQFEKLLRKGIMLTIGYGFGEDEDRSKYDIRAEEAVRKLANNYDNFLLKRLGDTHVKVLISDTKFAVVGSFNWLSFKGDVSRNFRDERSALVSDAQKIEELFAMEMKRFN